jgi:hypothetical protein
MKMLDRESELSSILDRLRRKIPFFEDLTDVEIIIFLKALSEAVDLTALLDKIRKLDS